MTSGAPKGRKWTQVLETRRAGVRADYRCVSAAEGERYVFEQLLAGTPFDRILREARTEIRMQPEQDGTRVTMTAEQRLRGLSRLGGLMMRRAMGPDPERGPERPRAGDRGRGRGSTAAVPAEPKWWGWGDPRRRLEVSGAQAAAIRSELGVEPGDGSEPIALEQVALPEARPLPSR